MSTTRPPAAPQVSLATFGSNSFSVTFNEKVNAVHRSFGIECPLGHPRGYALSSSPSASFTLKVHRVLKVGTVCRLAVHAGWVKDLARPPHALAKTYLKFFTVSSGTFLPPSTSTGSTSTGATGTGATGTSTTSTTSTGTTSTGATSTGTTSTGTTSTGTTSTSGTTTSGTTTTTGPTNNPPTDISLSAATVAENQPAGTTVGTLSATDPDAGDTAAFSLVSGTGSADNGSFAISGNTLTTAASFDFETKAGYSVRIRVTDSAGATFEKQFSIAVADVNEAPTGIALSAASVPENQPPATTVGTFSTTDPDVPAQTFAYSLVAGAGSADNSSFTISGNTLKTSASFDFETKSSYSIRVRTTDSGSPALSLEKVFTITVTDVNEVPTVLALSNTSVPENQPTGTAVGTFSSTDPDTGQTFTYTLVSGAGSADNGQFTIAGNTLKTAASFDFETKSSYSIRVRTTDSGSPALSLEKVFAIGVTDVNDAPTAIGLSNSNVPENQASGTAVGTFSSTDQDLPAQTFTYSLVGGTGSADNGSFTIIGNTLKTAASFDFETKSSYSVRVRTTDSGSPAMSFDKAFTVNVTDVNDAPTAIGLSNSSVPENQPSGTPVGTFSSSDQDVPAQTFTYTLVSGSGSTDNGSFSITGNTLKTAGSFDFETQSSYSIRVRTTDSGSPALSFEQVFTVSVTDVNEAPTDVLLSNSSVDENQPVGTFVGNLSAVDPDTTGTESFALSTAGCAGPDNGSFTIGAGNQLDTAATFDYEGQKSYTICVRVTDNGGLTFDKAFTIAVNDLNDAPTDIALSKASIDENQLSGTAVGTFSSTDQDVPAQTFTYSLVSGAGGDDNGQFTIAGNTLQTAAAFDFEAKSSYTILVQTTDSGNPARSFQKQFTITVNDINEAPTGVALDNSSVDENQPVGTTVGSLSDTDPDTTDTAAYSFATSGPVCPGTDNSFFSINSGALKTAAILDYEARSPVYTICVRVTDKGGLTYDQPLTVTVNNLNDTPTDIQLSPATVDENSPSGTTVGTMSATDQDQPPQSFTYSFVSAGGPSCSGPDNGSFAINGATLSTNGSLDFETKSVYEICVRATDSGIPQQSFKKALIINVNDVNEAPTDIALTNASIPENQLSGTTVGNLSDTDPDAGSTASFSLVTDATNCPTATDNSSFTTAGVNGVNLNSTASFDFEAKSSYTICVRATDNGAPTPLTFDKQFTISVTDADDPPTAVDDSATVAEDSGATAVPVLTNDTDPDSVASGFHVQTITAVTQPANGVVVITGGGTGLTYSPNSNYCNDSAAADTFTYTLNNGTVPSETATVSMTVTCVNDAPVNSVPGAQTVNEDTNLVFNSANANAISASDVDAGGAIVQVTVAVSHGTLTLSGTTGLGFGFSDANGAGSGNGTANASMTFRGTLADVNAALSGLTYAPAADYNGPDSLTITTNDLGNSGSGGPLTDVDSVGITVNSVNDAPAGTDKTINAALDGTLLEDGSYVFTTADFGFTDLHDSPANAFHAVEITTLPGAGSLTDNNIAVTTGQFVPVTDISANKLKFAPAADANGSNYASFTFQVQDDGGTTPGVDTDPTPNTMKLNVTPVNDAPSFTKGTDQTNIQNQDAGGNANAVTVSNWATSISKGPANESGQVLTFHVSNDNNSLFTVQPTVDPSTGALTFTTDPAHTGTANVDVYLTDDGGTAFGGNDTSATKSFKITTVLPPPVANDDGPSTDYAATGGIPIDIPAAIGVTKNDSLFGATISGYGKSTGSEDTTLGTATATAQGGFVTLNGNGSFHYDPPATPPATADTFVYTLTNGTGSDTAKVTISSSHQVIFVDASASASPETGSLDHPYNSLSDVPSGRNTGGVLFFYSGTYTRSDADGVTLKNSERLIGQGVALDGTSLGFTPAPDSVALPAASTKPTIGTSFASGNAVTLASGNTVEGVTAGAAAGASISGSSFGTFTITTAAINNTGAGAALSLNTGAFGSGSAIASISASPTGSIIGIGLTTVIGSLTVSGGSVSANSSGDAFKVSGGSVSVTDSGNLSQAGSGQLLNAAGGHTGTLIFQTGTLDATGGDGLLFNNADGTYTLSNGSTLHGGNAGVAVVSGSSGTMNLNGTAIANPTGTAFQVTGSAATVGDSGAISKTSLGTLVDIESNTGGSVTLSGNLSSTSTGIKVLSNTGGTYTFSGGTKTVNTGANDAVTLSSNTGATINFTGGGLAITTTTGKGLNATGGATAVNITGSNNTATAGTGTAVNIQSTTIGTSGITFKSVSANGAANGIVLNNTGAGGLTVTGDGGLSSNHSGGEILGSTGTAGISLNSAANVSLSYMDIKTGTHDGIHGDGVNNLTLNYDNVLNNGTTSSDEGLQLGEPSGNTVGVTGAVSITNSSISGSALNNVHIRDTSGTISSLTVTGDTFNNLGTTFGANSFLFEGSGSSTLTSATFNGNTIANNNPAHGLTVQAHDSSTIGTFTVSGNTFTNNGVQADFDQDASANLTFKLLNNGSAGSPMTGAILEAVNVFSSSTSTGGTIVGTIQGNFIGTSTAHSASTQGGGLRVEIQGHTDATILIDNNVIQGYDSDHRGIDVEDPGPVNTSPPAVTSDVTLTSNTVTPGASTSGFPSAAIFVGADNQSGSDATAQTLRADIHGNTVPSSLVTGDFLTGQLEYFLFTGAGSTGKAQLVGAAGTAAAQLASTNLGSTSASGSGITMIPGPITTPP